MFPLTNGMTIGVVLAMETDEMKVEDMQEFHVENKGFHLG